MPHDFFNETIFRIKSILAWRLFPNCRNSTPFLIKKRKTHVKQVYLKFIYIKNLNQSLKNQKTYFRIIFTKEYNTTFSEF